MDGEGEYTWPDGRHYKGSWRYDARHSEGTMIWTNGRSFNGTFENGTANGFGVIVYPHRRKIFEGYFQNGKAHGQGVMVFPDKTRVEGHYEEGTRNGVYDGSLDLQVEDFRTNNIFTSYKLSLALYKFERKKKKADEPIDVELYLPGNIIDKIIDQYVDNRCVSAIKNKKK